MKGSVINICYRRRNFNRLNLPPWLAGSLVDPGSPPTRPSQLVSRVVTIQMTTATTSMKMMTWKASTVVKYSCKSYSCKVKLQNTVV